MVGLIGAFALASCASGANQQTPLPAGTDHLTVSPGLAKRGTFVNGLWKVVAVEHADHTTHVPLDVRSWVSFSRRGEFMSYDSLNWSSGRYRSTPTGFRTVHTTDTLIGYMGHDPIQRAVIAGVDSLTFPSPSVIADVHGTQMLLHANGYTLLCKRTRELH